ncbi:unnamed protein product, partial [marine sediment metagenome]
TFTLDGIVTVNGSNGAPSYYGGGGGGSGGSVYVNAGTLTGSGLVSANGGNGGQIGYAGGGGGGRIAMYYSVSTFSGSFSACGGLGLGHGGAGTILTKSDAQASGDLLVDNCGNSGAFALATGQNTFDSITVTSQGKLDLDVAALTADQLTASDGGVVYLPGQVTAGAVDVGANAELGSRAAGLALTLTVLTDMTVSSGGVVSANGRGYGPGAGPGAGGEGPYGAAVVAAMGAWGETEKAVPGGAAYGSVTEPLQLGSGGGAESWSGGVGGAGGGAVRLTVGGTFTLDGIVTVNGSNGAPSYYGGGGGGSGGSVYVNAGTLTGSGLVSANGGNGGQIGYA